MIARRITVALLVLLVAAAAAVAWLNFRDEAPPPARAASDRAAQVATGEYLARIGNCGGCHTARGGQPFAGGRGIPTPFGVVRASNLTPDDETGLGRWTAEEFWRALHNGRSKDGRLLYPAFPYTSYTEVTREDSDALFAYLRSLQPVRLPNLPHELRFPYDNQVALAIWRALYFRPGVFERDASRDAAWNRGAYLVRGLGHCSACHSARNVLGATDEDAPLAGGAIPMQGWYAPSLASNREAGLGDWEIEHIVQLLKVGVTPRGSVLGPMAEVVFRSTQYLKDDDARAIATFLKVLPSTVAEVPRAESWPVVDTAVMDAGAEIYENRCADCHGKAGEGVAGMYPALAGNRAVTLASPANAIRAVLSGGFPPGTAGNPRPFGMPPSAPFLTDEEVAAVVSYIRNAWGNRASPVASWEVGRQTRGAARD
jgi:mono/diheme cytochrome c family protein